MAQRDPDIEAIRRRLLERKARLERELAEAEEHVARSDEVEAAGELSAYDDHAADTASETVEREKDFALAKSAESMLQRIQNALRKLDAGSYGLCDSCGRPISAQRLEALPFATLCLQCQSRSESR